MNIKQRDILTDFYRAVLENGSCGDFVNCYNDAKRMIIELAETDKTLKEYADIVEEYFENY